MRGRYTLHIRDAAARIALARGDPERALAHAELEVVGARRHGMGRIEARALVRRARALAALERHGDAEGAADAGLAVAGRVRYPPAQWRELARKADLARRTGRSGDADAYAARALKVDLLGVRRGRAIIRGSQHSPVGCGHGARVRGDPGEVEQSTSLPEIVTMLGEHPRRANRRAAEGEDSSTSGFQASVMRVQDPDGVRWAGERFRKSF
jgi:hypothetical protein